MPSLSRHPALTHCLLVGGITTGLLATALACLPALAAPRTAAPKPASPLAPYAGTWAPSVEQCRDPNLRVHERLRFDVEDDGVYDGRALDVGCHVAKAKTYPTGLTADLICEIGQESPFSFRTDIAIQRTGLRTLTLTNTFVDRKPEVLDYVRCTPKGPTAGLGWRVGRAGRTRPRPALHPAAPARGRVLCRTCLPR